MHKVFVEAGVLPREDIESLLFPVDKPKPTMPDKGENVPPKAPKKPEPPIATPETETGLKKLIRTLRKLH